MKQIISSNLKEFFDDREEILGQMSSKPIIRGNDSSTLIASVLEDETSITLYYQEALTPFKKIKFDCIDIAFLPTVYGNAFLAASKDGKLTLWREEGEENYVPTEITGFNTFSKCLRISKFPPQLLIGCICKGTICIFELLLDEKIKLLPIRRYRADDQFEWFDFASNQELWGATKSELFSYNIDYNDYQDRFALTSASECEFVDAVISPVDPKRIAILFKNGIVVVHGAREDIIETHLDNATDIQFSPLGCTIAVNAGIPTYIDEIPAGNWIIRENAE